MDRTPYEQELPGFRFYPTEEELLDFYLKGVLYGKRPTSQVIGTVNIYHHDPWELPGLAKIGEREWYFFVPRDKKNTHGGRPNRTTETGFWKATGSDRRIHSMKDPKRVIGMRKTLVFYKGRAPTGCKTDWIMNEYRMPENYPMPKEDIVLCKIYRKATSMKVLEQRAASEEYKGFLQADVSALMDIVSSPEEQSLQLTASPKEEESNEKGINGKESEATSRQMQMSCVKESLPHLELPTYNLEWMQDPYLFRSPWLENWSPYVNILNF